MAWLRSAAAIVLGGLLSFFLSCAGEGVLPNFGPRPVVEFPTAGAPNVTHEVDIPPRTNVKAVALEPTPYGTHYLALVLAALVAGYAAARIAGRAGLEHGLFTAWPSVVLLVAFIALDPQPRVGLAQLFDIGAGVLAGAAGGWMRDRRKLGVSQHPGIL